MTIVLGSNTSHRDPWIHRTLPLPLVQFVHLCSLSLHDRPCPHHIIAISVHQASVLFVSPDILDRASR